MQKIDSLQSLRGIAFLGVFGVHAGLMAYPWAAASVSVFFILSGFLLSVRYKDSPACHAGPAGACLFAVTKIRRIYCLHIITMLLAAALLYYRNASLEPLLWQVLLNICLLQTLVPDVQTGISLNGTAWYLSVTMLLYMLFPLLHGWLSGRKSGRQAVLAMAVIIACQLGAAWAVLEIGGKDDFFLWFTYLCPFFRAGDFACGILLGNMYCNGSRIGGNRAADALFVLVAAMYVWIAIFLPGEHSGTASRLLANWTTVMIAPGMLLVYLFADIHGFLCRMLHNRLFLYLGNISAYTYLIHFVVIMYFDAFIKAYHIQLAGCVTALASLLISVLLAELYCSIQGRGGQR